MEMLSKLAARASKTLALALIATATVAPAQAQDLSDRILAQSRYERSTGTPSLSKAIFFGDTHHVIFGIVEGGTTCHISLRDSVNGHSRFISTSHPKTNRVRDFRDCIPEAELVAFVTNHVERYLTPHINHL
ncbi:hypothetical protein [Ferrimonas marina]|uniref:Uncharacterized protein n=1 Tax=Ferrimonas marina TaxID=299255 RepID=A0A1M5TL99_9GAMM|nr:hypothetical protein [Ferrimonas marina]SHH51451.1 hypothetical protein SAMN02745129_2188 [Ferrimonas marina]